MATGGYKCVKFSWQGGRSDTPVDRVKFILNGVCDAIIGANVGWALDTLTPTSSDFVTVPSFDDATYPILVKVLTLSYNEHVYKLGIGYVYSGAGTRDLYKINPDDSCNTREQNSYVSSQNGYFSGGLFVGMIKDGLFIQDNNYGLSWNHNGIFTKWTPFCSQYSTGTDSFANVNNGGSIYTVFILIKNAQIAIFERSSNWSVGANLKCLIIGELFKETGHISDINTIGTICLHNPIALEYDIGSSSTSKVYINSTVGDISFPNYTSSYLVSSILDLNGNAYAGDKVVNNSTVEYQPYIEFDTLIINNYVSSVVESPGGRWTPCYMCLRSLAHDTYGVVPGDGFKGYIDTDLLRGVNPNYSYGQQLQGGDFVYLGGGFAIGWDVDNEILLF